MNLPFSQTLPEKWLFGSNQKEVKNPKEDKQKKITELWRRGRGRGRERQEGEKMEGKLGGILLLG